MPKAKISVGFIYIFTRAAMNSVLQAFYNKLMALFWITFFASLESLYTSRISLKIVSRKFIAQFP
jgi:hypothetical protein